MPIPCRGLPYPSPAGGNLTPDPLAARGREFPKCGKYILWTIKVPLKVPLGHSILQFSTLISRSKCAELRRGRSIFQEKSFFSKLFHLKWVNNKSLDILKRFCFFICSNDSYTGNKGLGVDQFSVWRRSDSNSQPPSVSATQEAEWSRIVS